MGKLNVATIRKRLLAEEARLLSERDRLLSSETSRLTENGGELSDYDSNHPSDAGAELFEREKNMALSANLRSSLSQVRAALDRLDHGTYGICARCGVEISPARLKALPYAELCVECQSRVESA